MTIHVNKSNSAFISLSALFVVFAAGSFTIPGVSEHIQDLAYNLIRTAIFFLAGYLYCKENPCDFKKIAYLAAGLSLFDHVVLKGGLFILYGLLGNESDIHVAITAFKGVLISYALYLPVVLIFVYLGSKAASFFQNRHQ